MVFELSNGKKISIPLSDFIYINEHNVCNFNITWKEFQEMHFVEAESLEESKFLLVRTNYFNPEWVIYSGNNMDGAYVLFEFRTPDAKRKVSRGLFSSIEFWEDIYLRIFGKFLLTEAIEKGMRAVRIQGVGDTHAVVDLHNFSKKFECHGLQAISEADLPQIDVPTLIDVCLKKKMPLL